MKHVLFVSLLFLLSCSDSDQLNGNTYQLQFHPVQEGREAVFVSDQMNDQELYITFSNGNFELTGKEVNESGPYSIQGDTLHWIEKGRLHEQNDLLILSYDDLSFIELIPVE